MNQRYILFRKIGNAANVQKQKSPSPCGNGDLLLFKRLLVFQFCAKELAVHTGDVAD